MTPSRSLLADTVVTGAATAFVTFLVPALMRAARGAPIAAPLNAESHVLWGDEAAVHDEISARYTGTGIATHVGACLFWSGIYEAAMGEVVRRTATHDVAGGIATAAAAYVIDYHVVARRFTPGFELRYSPGEMLAFFVALAATLPLRRLAARPRRVIRRWPRSRRTPTAPVFADHRPVAIES
jgi:hypothetical protein